MRNHKPHFSLVEVPPSSPPDEYGGLLGFLVSVPCNLPGVLASGLFCEPSPSILLGHQTNLLLSDGRVVFNKKTQSVVLRHDFWFGVPSRLYGAWLCILSRKFPGTPPTSQALVGFLNGFSKRAIYCFFFFFFQLFGTCGILPSQHCQFVYDIAPIQIMIFSFF